MYVCIQVISNLSTQPRLESWRSGHEARSAETGNRYSRRIGRKVSFPPHAIPKSHAHTPTDLIGTNRQEHMIRGRACCKSDGSTNLRGRLHHGNGGHGHWVSHVARRRVGEAPRHVVGRCESRDARATARGPALRSTANRRGNFDSREEIRRNGSRRAGFGSCVAARVSRGGEGNFFSGGYARWERKKRDRKSVV